MNPRAVPSRRRVLGAAAVSAAAGSATAVVAAAAPAEADEPLPRPARAPAPRLLGRSGRHLVGRFSYGITPALAAEVAAAGGPSAWFEQQLSPEQVADPGVHRLRGWFGPGLRLEAPELWQRNVDEVESGWQVMANYARWCLLRRMRSRRQVREVMTEFWENHLHVPVDGDAQFLFRTDYGLRIREQALTSFDRLLHTAVTHPAMLVFLDQAVSTKRHPNENLARELLELHTVGRGAYDEDDVKDSARILTGWRVDMWNTWRAWYEPGDHARGPVKVMDFEHPNDDADGREVTRLYLAYLARHPATARRVCRRLAVKFVCDDPSEELVEQLAEVYLAHDTEIKPVLRALVASAEFRASRAMKVRDPGEDLVATYRALDVRVRRPRRERSAAYALLWQCSAMGTRPFGWPRPDGQPLDNEAWSSPARLLAAMNVHYVMCGTWWPNQDIRYRTPTSWAPRLPVRFDVLVDHLAVQLLHRRSSARLLRACCDAVECRPDERITEDHPVMRWNAPRLLTTFLDSPHFYAR